jgi:thiol-disulfide isomerase/thioredoxin
MFAEPTTVMRFMRFIFPESAPTGYDGSPTRPREDARMLPLLALALIAAESPAVRLDSVRYDDLAAEVKTLKGKVVLVDVWGSFCVPCKEKFPHVVALHNKYAARGLNVISVSVDPPDDADAKNAARDFLVRQKATFRNVILTDRAEVWQAKWKLDGPPLLFLFDKQGRLAGRWEGKFDPAELDRKVATLLGE